MNITRNYYKMYCGNNALRNDVGNRYSCMKKGIGVGQRQDNLEIYFSRIQSEKIYCGNKGNPENGTRKGEPLECLRKGIGIGKSLAFKRCLNELINDIEEIIANK